MNGPASVAPVKRVGNARLLCSSRELSDAGTPEAQAEILADEQAEPVNEKPATKADLVPLAGKADLAEAKFEIIRRLFATIGFQTLIIIGAVIALAPFAQSIVVVSVPAGAARQTEVAGSVWQIVTASGRDAPLKSVSSVISPRLPILSLATAKAAPWFRLNGTLSTPSFEAVAPSTMMSGTGPAE
jgi:hypothetical protein